MTLCITKICAYQRASFSTSHWYCPLLQLDLYTSAMMEVPVTILESIIRWYHVYREIWTLRIEEVQSDLENEHDYEAM